MQYTIFLFDIMSLFTSQNALKIIFLYVHFQNQTHTLFCN